MSAVRMRAVRFRPVTADNLAQKALKQAGFQLEGIILWESRYARRG
jgi:hypothetical protein